MVTILGLPSADHRTFAHPPLKAMLGQVRFPSILKVTDPAGVASFQDALRKRYPDVRREQQVNIVIEAGGVSTQPEARSWRLLDPTSSWSVVIAPDFVTLEAGTPYTHYEDFRERFADVWKAASLLEPAQRIQQGLRYINHLENDDPSFDWSEFINPALLGFLADSERLGQLEHSLSDHRFKLNDGTLVLKHGLVRAGEHNARGYLLDLDHFTQVQPDELSLDEVLTTFDRFHESIYDIFDWAMTDRAKKEFRHTHA